MRNTVLLVAVLAILVMLVGCSAPPSDEKVNTEITEYAKKCSWKIKVPNKEISETYSGSRVQIDGISIVAKSFESTDGSVKFTLKGKKSGKPDINAWYGWSYESAQPYLSELFSFEGEWKFKKYDKGWKISQEPTTYEAVYVK